MQAARKRTEAATNSMSRKRKKLDGDGQDRGYKSEASRSSKPKKKTVNHKSKKDDKRQALAHSLEAIHQVVLVDEAVRELKLRFHEQSLGNLVESLCNNGELVEELVEYHWSSFAKLYLENGKKKDPFLTFQFNWHRNCSALLLEENMNWLNLVLMKHPVPKCIL